MYYLNLLKELHPYLTTNNYHLLCFLNKQCYNFFTSDAMINERIYKIYQEKYSGGNYQQELKILFDNFSYITIYRLLSTYKFRKEKVYGKYYLFLHNLIRGIIIKNKTTAFAQDLPAVKYLYISENFLETSLGVPNYFAHTYFNILSYLILHSTNTGAAIKMMLELHKDFTKHVVLKTGTCYHISYTLGEQCQNVTLSNRKGSFCFHHSDNKLMLKSVDHNIYLNIFLANKVVLANTANYNVVLRLRSDVKNYIKKVKLYNNPIHNKMIQS
jgi:hypothetical protein